ncbi:sugar/nucleoside kinase (ribokinase family) [Stackebrandtia albiflava]|uniref:Sugar/nucleoside kinase (Ribokinase family) n=1 Tax=Stackebrandtia albiflava TaxID=406432 RepID=A0A562V515_9ACTN|nr:PfkB family carbohydrate kinase [Stackebrandtia albiflava]TWJ12963.1 sugar/nucleoside kinase (ribokinase family) [Stackebrandtia albiflava]
MYDVLVIGGSGVDTTVRVPELPFETRDSLHVPPVRDHVGNTGSGYARACHRLGLRTGLVDLIGDDPQGEMIRETFAREGLDFHHLISPAGTPRSVNLVDGTGRRMSLHDGRHPVDLRIPVEFARPLIAEARHVHQSITGVNRDLFGEIRAAGATVSTDLHDWDGEQAHHLDYALGSDLVFLSAVALRDRRDEVMERIRADGRARVVVATDGDRGCHVLTGDGLLRVPAIRPDEVFASLPEWRGWSCVDSNGAGDAFASGFLWAWTRGESIAECATAGSIAGAYTCRSAGTHTDLIDAAGLAAARQAVPGAVTKSINSSTRPSSAGSRSV